MESLKRSLLSMGHPGDDPELMKGLLMKETPSTSALASRLARFIKSLTIAILPLPSRLARFVKSLTLATLPLPIASRLAPHLYKPARIHATSYLDGLRGIASFIVFLHHFTFLVPPYLTYYGVDTTETRSQSVIQLPFIRVIISGSPMVHVFFVISGFVLSRKPLKLARAGNYSDLYTTVSSSIFRRGLRLFLPVAASTFIVLLLICTGWHQQQPVDGGFWAQMRDWASVIFRITQGWHWDDFQDFRYDDHVWTLPVEMTMAMLLFITIMGLSKCESLTRLVLMLMIMVYCFFSHRWAAVEFLGGAFIAEVDLMDEDRASCSSSRLISTDLEKHANDQVATDSNPTSTQGPRWSGTVPAIFWSSQLAVAFFLAGWPINCGDIWKAPGIAWLAGHTPEPYYSDWIVTPWYMIASLQIVLACHQLPLLQRFLSTGPIQYLGSISFALYLTHGPLLKSSLCNRIMELIWEFAGLPGEAGIREERASARQLFFVWIAGAFSLGILSVWVADLFWRLVDQPSVDFARWLDGRCKRRERSIVL